MKTVGERIEAARTRLGMTRPQLAANWGLTQQAVYEWERHDKRPDIDRLIELARALKVPLAWLLAGKGAPPSPEDPRVAIEDLEGEDRDMLEQFLRFLADRKKRNRDAG